MQDVRTPCVAHILISSHINMDVLPFYLQAQYLDGLVNANVRHIYNVIVRAVTCVHVVN